MFKHQVGISALWIFEIVHKLIGVRVLYLAQDFRFVSDRIQDRRITCIAHLDHKLTHLLFFFAVPIFVILYPVARVNDSGTPLKSKQN